MTDANFDVPSTAIAARTLIAAGFSITQSNRQPAHIELSCECTDVFGATVRYLIVVCDAAIPRPQVLQAIAKEATKDGRVLVTISPDADTATVSWSTFLKTLGGAVPSWRALSANYADVLLTSGQNRHHSEAPGEPWETFEDAIADGFEFLLGRRVLRQGGRKRGLKVSDIVARTPDDMVLVIDAKSSGAAFSVGWPELRPLVEYTKKQLARQSGSARVGAALLVAIAFSQDEARLRELSDEFLAETAVPLSFLQANDLAWLVNRLTGEPVLRAAVRWPYVFCQPGISGRAKFELEIAAAKAERV